MQKLFLLNVEEGGLGIVKVVIFVMMMEVDLNTLIFSLGLRGFFLSWFGLVSIDRYGMVVVKAALG